MVDLSELDKEWTSIILLFYYSVTKILSEGQKDCILEHEQATVREKMAVPQDGSMVLENHAFISICFICYKHVPRRGKFKNSTEYSI